MGLKSKPSALIGQPDGAGTRTSGIQSVNRVLNVFDYLEKCPNGAGVIEVSEELGIHKSTASRILASMKSVGYLDRSNLTGKYLLGMRLVELARAKLDQVDIRVYARPFLEELYGRTKETVHLAIMEQGTLVYIDKIDAPHILTMRSRIGYRISPHCTALGKAILSLLPDTKKDDILENTELHRCTPKTITDLAQFKNNLRQVATQGFALDDEEHEEGIRCAAAAVRDYTGDVAGAISVSAPTTRMTRERLAEVGVLVKEVCAQLSVSLGYNGS